MNKKAFTMIELILIMIIISVILLFALPNVMVTIERNKKDLMINDAKDFIEKAKDCVNTKRCADLASTTDKKTYTLSTIDLREEIKKSPFGKVYDRENSKILIEQTQQLVGGNYVYVKKYSVTLTDGTYKIIDKTIKELNSDSKYSTVQH